MLIIPAHVISEATTLALSAFFNTSNENVLENAYEDIYRKSFPPPFFDESSTGVSRKTLKNIAQKRHVPTQQSIQTIEKTLTSYFTNIPGVSVTEGRFEDKYQSYSINCFARAAVASSTVYRNLKSVNGPLEEAVVVDIFNRSGLLQDLVHFNFSDFGRTSPDLLFQGVNRLRIDLAFYLLASQEVEYRYHFYPKDLKNKSLLDDCMPKIEENRRKQTILVKPLKLLLQRIALKHGFGNIEQLSKAIKWTGDGEDPRGDSTKKRLVMKWVMGKRFPSVQAIDALSLMLAEKMPRDDEDHIPMAIEEGRYVFGFIKIFQKLLKMILVHKDELFGWNEQEVVGYFKRYLYWHNHHLAELHESLGESPSR